MDQANPQAATIRLTIGNVGSLGRKHAVASTVNIKNIPWSLSAWYENIGSRNIPDRFLVVCLSRDDYYMKNITECKIRADLRIIGQRSGCCDMSFKTESSIKKIGHVRRFAVLSERSNRNSGYIIDDTIIIEAWVMVDPPESITHETKTQDPHCDEAKSLFEIQLMREADGIQHFSPSEDLSIDFSYLLETGTLSDFTVELDNGERMQVHKTVLAARSPVLAKIIIESTKENKENSVDITLFDQIIVKKFIKYLYTGKVEFGEDCKVSTIDLLKLADYYGVTRLKDICEVELIENLSDEIVIDAWVLADNYEVPRLRKCALEILSKIKSRLDIQKLFDVVSQKPNLLKDLLI